MPPMRGDSTADAHQIVVQPHHLAALEPDRRIDGVVEQLAEPHAQPLRPRPGVSTPGSLTKASAAELPRPARAVTG